MPVKTPPRENRIVSSFATRVPPRSWGGHYPDAPDQPLSWSSPTGWPRQFARGCFGQGLLWRVMGGHGTVWIQRTIRWATGWFRRSLRRCRSWCCWDCSPPAGSSAWKAALAGLVAACGVAWLSFRHAGPNDRGQHGGRRVFRPSADRLADRGRRLPLRHHGRDRPVRGHESFRGPALRRPSAASGAGRVLFRRVHRGGRRICGTRWRSPRPFWWDWGFSRSRRPCSA